MKVVIFDVDGTLVDSQALIVQSMNAGIARAGLPELSREKILSIVGLSLAVAVAELVPSASEAQRAAVVEGYRDAFHQARLRESSPLYPGAAEGLAVLAGRDDLLLAVATGKARRGLNAMIEAHGWEKLFFSTQTADDHPSKPHPSMIETILSESGLSPRDAVMVGDTGFDMEMARAAGVAGFGVSWGYHPDEVLTAAGARLIAPDYPALLQSLLEWADE